MDFGPERLFLSTENNIIISESTYRQVKDKVETKFIDEATVKGKKNVIKIHELLRMK